MGATASKMQKDVAQKVVTHGGVCECGHLNQFMYLICNCIATVSIVVANAAKLWLLYSKVVNCFEVSKFENSDKFL